MIRLPGALMALLERQMKRTSGPHVFESNGSLCKLFDRILVRAGIAREEKDKHGRVIMLHKTDALGRKLTAHSFRHTFATLQAQAVAFNPFLLKEILGHSQLSTTDRYCHASGVATVIDVAGLLGGGVKGWCEEKEKGPAENPQAL